MINFLKMHEARKENYLTTIKLNPFDLPDIEEIMVVDMAVQGQYPYNELRKWLDQYAGKHSWNWYFDTESRLNIDFIDCRVATLFKLTWV